MRVKPPPLLFATAQFNSSPVSSMVIVLLEGFFALQSMELKVLVFKNILFLTSTKHCQKKAKKFAFVPSMLGTKLEFKVINS